MNLGDLADALKIASYKRVAVQVHDSFLSSAPDLVADLQKLLPNAIVSLLGDSVTQCCLDEVSAEHYGSDCIVKLGHTCWFASQRMVAYFVPHCRLDADDICREFQAFRELSQNVSPVVLFVDRVEDVSSILNLSSIVIGELYIALSVCMSYPGSEQGKNWLFSRPFVSMAIPSLVSRVRRVDPTVAGRLLFYYNGQYFKPVLDQSRVDVLLSDPFTSFLLPKMNDGTYTRLVNRFGSSRIDRVVASGIAPRSNYPELLRGYRGVESVKMAMSVGIVVTHCSASRELFQVRDILSIFLRALNKEVHMFSVGKVDGVKLGNFPEIEVFIILSCPESQPELDPSVLSDLAASCVGPFEALVAVEALEWAEYIITDYDEMLAKMVSEPPARTPRTPRTRRPPRANLHAAANKTPPARIEMGLRGIPSKYSSEPNE